MRLILSFIITSVIFIFAVFAVSGSLNKTDGTVFYNATNLLQGVSSSSPSVLKLDKMQTVNPIYVNGNYILITLNVANEIIYGYVPKNAMKNNHLNTISPYKINKNGVVNVGYDTLNMRLQANTNPVNINGNNYSIFGEIEDGQTIRVLFEKNGFYFAEAKLISGKTARGFVSSKYVILE